MLRDVRFLSAKMAIVGGGDIIWGRDRHCVYYFVYIFGT